MNQRLRILILINTLVFAGVLWVNYLANALPINGKTTGELSNQYPNLFTPAGLTFSIWGVIYLWLLAFSVVCLWGLFSFGSLQKISSAVQKINIWFALSSLLNIAWIFAWHYEQLALSVAIMIGLLGSLVILNRRLNQNSDAVASWIRLPFGIYQGWITVALIANVTAWLVALGWKGGGISEGVWAVLMIGAGTFIALVFWTKQRNLGHVLAVLWALAGIYLKRKAATEPDSPMVALVALVGIGTLAAIVANSLRKKHSSV
ncbi:MAG: hypothetical protein IT261_13590 [Saprospiraceae bacterium]|nr:hypothetical protein [Saprospiraceae bacterium]